MLGRWPKHNSPYYPNAAHQLPLLQHREAVDQLDMVGAAFSYEHTIVPQHTLTDDCSWRTK